jgi:hypothetical protein
MTCCDCQQVNRQSNIALSGLPGKVQNTLQALISKSTDLANKLKALSDELSDLLLQRH